MKSTITPGGVAGLVLAASGIVFSSPTSPAAFESSPIPASAYCSILEKSPREPCKSIQEDFLGLQSISGHHDNRADAHIFEDAFKALEILQRDYFDPNIGTWTSAIDWTAAFTQTLVTGTLSTLSRSIKDIASDQTIDWKAKENLVSSYYTHVVSSYFGQDILSLRGQAYDDMLWVVLGWLEAIKFVDIHTELHYSDSNAHGFPNDLESQGLWRALKSLPWQGHHWVRSFAHRARIFWTLSSRGWDTSLCDGGMVWNPRLAPYKNAITNELWIAASTSMYIHFPGDNFTAPWSIDRPFPEQDATHLEAAIKGYKWLTSVNMTNSQGLFVDGYHIDFQKPSNITCDLRDEMVYTYNQGVLLTGQRGLWAITGSPSYLEDGHRLIQNAITATGWSLEQDTPTDDLSKLPHGQLPRWHGLGRGGVMEEGCDASGTCSQDAQTFKAIFFHHLTNFCNELDPIKINTGSSLDVEGFEKVKTAHANACKAYLGWTKHNALAALATRNEDGHFGMWWGASLFGNVSVPASQDGIDHEASNTTDYRNKGTPRDYTWGMSERWLPGQGNGSGRSRAMGVQDFGSEEQLMMGPSQAEPSRLGQRSESKDANDRGRGRTVETQLGGLAVLRAYWELSQDR